MSRIGRLPVAVPAGVDVTLEGRTLTVKGPKGTLTRELPPVVTVAREGDAIVVTRPNDEKEARSLHGLTRTLVRALPQAVDGFYADRCPQHAAGIRAPLTTEVFSDGKRYPVTIQPKGTRTHEWNRQQVPAAVFEVVPAGQQKDGGFTLWLSKDERRLPLRIILEQKYGSLDLRLR